MKITTTTFFALFLLSTLISNLPSTTLAFTSILDTDGNPLVNGGTYYILPILRILGGMELVATGNETCPLTVIQSRFELHQGLPIVISSVYEISHLYEGLPLELSFSTVPTCASIPSKWTIVKGLPEGSSVKITGYENTENGSFKIEKSLSEYYKLTFCAVPSGSCSDIGIYVDDDEYRHLVANEDPLTVKFQKVHDPCSHASV